MDFFVVFCKLSAFLFLQDTKDELAAVSKNKHKKNRLCNQFRRDFQFYTS